jgi:hypothetical protein
MTSAGTVAAARARDRTQARLELGDLTVEFPHVHHCALEHLSRQYMSCQQVVVQQ